MNDPLGRHYSLRDKNLQSLKAGFMEKPLDRFKRKMELHKGKSKK